MRLTTGRSLCDAITILVNLPLGVSEAASHLQSWFSSQGYGQQDSQNDSQGGDIRGEKYRDD